MKAISEAVLGRMGKSLGVWGKMISNIWSTRSFWEFRSFCGVLSLPILFQQIGVKLTDMHALHTCMICMLMHFGMEAITVVTA